jgi:hypothetical protein
VAGFLAAAALVGAGTVKQEAEPGLLSLWKGLGARPGLYREWIKSVEGREGIRFYDCKLIGPARLLPPPPRP